MNYYIFKNGVSGFGWSSTPNTREAEPETWADLIPVCLPIFYNHAKKKG